MLDPPVLIAQRASVGSKGFQIDDERAALESAERILDLDDGRSCGVGLVYAVEEVAPALGERQQEFSLGP